MKEDEGGLREREEWRSGGVEWRMFRLKKEKILKKEFKRTRTNFKKGKKKKK